MQPEFSSPNFRDIVLCVSLSLLHTLLLSLHPCFFQLVVDILQYFDEASLTFTLLLQRIVKVRTILSPSNNVLQKLKDVLRYLNRWFPGND